MSIYHPTDTHADVLSAPFRATRDAVDTVMATMATVLTALRAALLRHWTQRHLARLSDHMLRDFGFERDWDGTIRPLRDAD